MEIQQQAVTCACGHIQMVSLVSSSAQACENILTVLRRSLCHRCQRKSRFEAAYACTQRAGLFPLQAASPQQVALAEIVRASLWRVFCPCTAERPCCQLLAALFNRQTRASFWLALRGWPLYRLTPEQMEDLMLKLLQSQSREAGKKVEESR